MSLDVSYKIKYYKAIHNGRAYLEAEALVMIGVTEVSVVEQPDIAHVEHFVVGACEELSEVLGGLEEISEPDHGGQICASALEEVPPQLNLVSVLLQGRL
jgi:hypothetical protein